MSMFGGGFWKSGQFASGVFAGAAAAALVGSGDLTPVASAISGSGAIGESGSGSLQALCVISGTGGVSETGSGSLAADMATLSGNGAAGPSGSGALVAGACTIAGVGRWIPFSARYARRAVAEVSVYPCIEVRVVQR